MTSGSANYVTLAVDKTHDVLFYSNLDGNPRGIFKYSLSNTTTGQTTVYTYEAHMMIDTTTGDLYATDSSFGIVNRFFYPSYSTSTQVANFGVDGLGITPPPMIVVFSSTYSDGTVRYSNGSDANVIIYNDNGDKPWGVAATMICPNGKKTNKQTHTYTKLQK